MKFYEVKNKWIKDDVTIFSILGFEFGYCSYTKEFPFWKRFLPAYKRID